MAFCNDNSDCGQRNYCSDKNQCKHESIFQDDALQISFYILLGVICGISNIAGISGGLSKVISMMLMLNYSNKESTVYIYPILLGMKISDFLVTHKLKNPSFPKKPLIDFDLTLILQPNVLLGASIGVLVNMTLANFLIIIAFVIFLTYSSFKAFLNVKKIYLKNKNQLNTKQVEEEVKQFQQEEIKINKFQSQLKQPEGDEPFQVELEIQQNEDKSFQNQVQEIQKRECKDKRYLIFLEREKQQIPIIKFGAQILIFIIYFLVFWFTGGPRYKSLLGIEKCSAGFWLMFAFQFLLTIFFNAIIFLFYKKETQMKDDNNYTYQKGEIKYGKGYSSFIISGTISGFVIGAVGDGVGMFLTPILVDMGINQRAASAISGLIIIYSSGTSIIISLLNGTISGYDFLFMLGINLIPGWIFTEIFNYLITKYKMKYINILLNGISTVTFIIVYVTLSGIEMQKTGISAQMKFSSIFE